MLPRFLSLGIGALALLVVLGATGQVHAQHGRGGVPHVGHPVFRSPMMSGFRGGFDPRFHRGFFDSRFNRGFFDPRFHRGFFDPRFNRGFFFDPRFNRSFMVPRFIPGFGPTFMRPF
jgi:hypothetical protein